MAAETNGPALDVALVHYPVLNKRGEIVGSAVTNLDLHDIARAAKTFGVGTLYVVTPFADQRQLAGEILEHWLSGPGATYNSKRKEALALVSLSVDLAEAVARTEKKRGTRPVILATGASMPDRGWSYEDVSRRLAAGTPILLVFGTGWGLAPEVMDEVDGSLPPIRGRGTYNHLSVRSAASIILDRILGRPADTVNAAGAGDRL